MSLEKRFGINAKLTRVKSHKADFFRENPSASILATKLIPDHRRPNETLSDEGVTVTNDTVFNVLTQNRAKKNMDAETILRLNPDIKLIRETLVSCIRSPLSMEDDSLFFKVGDSDLPLSLLNALLSPVQSHFTKDHDLGAELSDMIADSLVNTGASIRAIIPEASLDDLINKTTRPSNESWQVAVNAHFFDKEAGILKSVGILGGPENPSSSAQVPSFELYTDEPEPNQKIGECIYITDNSAQLRLPAMNAAFNMAKMRSKLSPYAEPGRLPRTSTESGNVFLGPVNASPAEKKAIARNIESIQQALYRPQGTNRTKRSPYGNTQVIRSGYEASRSSVGHPLVVPLLNESTIPVFVPGNTRRHVGYYVITDGFGQPLNVTQDLKRLQEQGTFLTDQTTGMLQQTNSMQVGTCCGNDSGSAERLRQFSEFMEVQLLNRLKNGLRGMSVTIKHDEDIMRLMFMRQLANEMTHIVFLAADQVAYLAYEYDSNGMGVSMLDGVKQVATLRTMCNFANFMASIRNAVGRTRVSINIDERDPDPEKSAAILQDEFLRSQAAITPTDVASSAEMFRVIRQMGIVFDIQGNQRIPNTSVNVEDFHSNKQIIDNDFMDRLEKQVYMGFYVTPEMVDATQSSDFAITRWTTNQLFAKRIKNLQKTTEGFLEKYVSVYALSSGTLIHSLQNIIQASKDKIPEHYLESDHEKGVNNVLYSEIIGEFFRVLEVKLPSPDNTKLDTQMEQLNKYVQGLDLALNAWIAADFMDIATHETDSPHLGQVIAAVKAYYIRQYMLENNIFPELADLTRKGTEDNPALNISKEVMLHMENFIQNLGDWGAAMKMRRELYINNVEQKNAPYAEAIQTGSYSAPASQTTTNDVVDMNAAPPSPEEEMPSFDDGDNTLPPEPTLPSDPTR